ncbi:MAG: glycosyltransferase [Candidatus Gastranaerophilales bacterium]|nr:glycosyltransferase [Candidatus Gastranaerophilales bacterium]
MNILFLHRDYPAQFKYLALALANNPANNVMFATENDTIDIKGITKYVFKISHDKKTTNPYLTLYDEVLEYAQAAIKIAKEIKAKGIKPDVIYGFGFWGFDMFMKDVFPDVPVISYFEWFYNTKGADIGFDGKTFTEEENAQMRCKNSHLLVDLYSCDAGISPTYWQRNQFPKEFHEKIKVIHDGIDTETCCPNPNAEFFIAKKDLKLTVKDEVITYGTRGMEPYRGFVQFMEAAEKLLKKRPNAHIVIAGLDDVYYGPRLKECTYKEYMLKKLDLDTSRLHFVGALSFVDYVRLLQISSVHVYLTFPYILSWSILNAMSAGCCVIASDTAPVLEVIQDNYNGLLFNFYNIDQLVEKVDYALENRNKMLEIRNNARQTVLDKYDVRKLLMQQINFINSVIVKHRGAQQ